MRSLQARALRPLVSAIAPHGPAALRGAGLPATIFDTESRVARTRSDALWQSAVDRTDGLLPLRIADRVGPRTYGHLTYLLAATASVGEMLRAVCRYYPALLGDTTQHRVETSRSRVRLTIDPLGRRPPCVELFSVAVVASFVRRHAGVTPRRVFVGGSARGLPTAELRASFQCPVDEAELDLGLEFAATDMMAPIRGADPQLRALLEEHARWRTGQRSSMRARVEAQVRDHGPRPTLRASDVAAGLGVSVRTLRRHLASEATSFQAILDEVLRQEALERLQHSTVEDTARTLGYADGSALRRAHRRWFGTSPRSVNPRASPAR